MEVIPRNILYFKVLSYQALFPFQLKMPTVLYKSVLLKKVGNPISILGKYYLEFKIIYSY